MNWIKVEDGLPEEGRLILIRIWTGAAVWYETCDQDGVDNMLDYGPHLTVTHWAYITEPED